MQLQAQHYAHVLPPSDIHPNGLIEFISISGDKYHYQVLNGWSTPVIAKAIESEYRKNSIEAPMFELEREAAFKNQRDNHPKQGFYVEKLGDLIS
jgi:hypothetical protein